MYQEQQIHDNQDEVPDFSYTDIRKHIKTGCSHIAGYNNDRYIHAVWIYA